ncbi:MAG: protein-methionine-sulfoxide reductase catalytic subunit MsrP [Paracoccus sp. (in: a-proteobacteria)]|nr:protein-methionine-sulfoxide reductase catalytic subunit MsrP [Paracoccus sp. (in: a-proteobacteria)]
MKLGWSDVTPKAMWLSRRAFVSGLGAMMAAPSLARASFSTDEAPNSFEEITNYNNFYEFGFGKEDPARYAHMLRPEPWAVAIDGLVERPGSYSVADLAPENTVEERIYRLRCVEGWSMVIPWLGVPLGPILERAGVQPGARYVAFETLLDPDQMPAQKTRSMPWPYVEGLRLDEAMHPLTILATGLYGEAMPNQNGAPIRLVVPWKYGFKSIKSIVRISLTEEQPPTTWQRLQPQEYGFYANVNPDVDHPRWSQATERRIGAGLFAGRQPTEMFNGYAEHVAHLYAGMDLARDY